MSEKQYEAGLAERKAVLGADNVDKTLAAADSFNREFPRMVTEYCWGGTWARGVLTRKERSLINLVVLSALNRPHELAGVEAFRLARERLNEQGLRPPS